MPTSTGQSDTDWHANDEPRRYAKPFAIHAGFAGDAVAADTRWHARVGMELGAARLAAARATMARRHKPSVRSYPHSFSPERLSAASRLRVADPFSSHGPRVIHNDRRVMSAAPFSKALTGYVSTALYAEFLPMAFTPDGIDARSRTPKEAELARQTWSYDVTFKLAKGEIGK